jgi:hypothetical protein
VACGPGGGAGRAEEGRARWLGGAPFLIPDLKASDVHLKGPSPKIQRGPFHQQVVLREDRVAGVALLSIAWTTPSRSYAVMWKATILDLAPDEEMESFVVQHVGLPGLDNETRQIHPGLDAGASTRKA